MKTLKSVLLAASLFAAGAAWADAIIQQRATDAKGHAVELRIADGKVTGPKGEKIADGKYTLLSGQKIDVAQGKAVVDPNFRPGAAIDPNFKPGAAIDPNFKPGATINADGKTGETRGVIIPNYKNAKSASDGNSADAHGLIIPNYKSTGK